MRDMDVLRSFASLVVETSGLRRSAAPGCAARVHACVRLLALPHLGADLAAAGIGPDAGPVAAVRAVERKPGVVAGAVRDGQEILVANAGADIARAADHPDDAVGFAGLLDGDRAVIFAAAARIGALDVVFADRI